jgi:hypothetical protein
MLARILDFKVEKKIVSQTNPLDGMIVNFSRDSRRLLITLEVLMSESGVSIDEGLRNALANNEDVELRAVKNIKSPQLVESIISPSDKKFKDHW